jgi:hypothetical protein
VNISSDIAPTFGEVEMKLVMSTAGAAVVLALLATGLAEAEEKNCTTVVRECRLEVKGAMGHFHWVDRDPGGPYAKVSACVSRRGCVPRFPPID